MKRIALAGFIASIVLIGIVQLAVLIAVEVPGWAPWAMMAGTAGSLCSVTALGAVRAGRLGGLGWVFGALLLLLLGCFTLALVLPPTDPANPTLWLGLPPRAAILLYGIGLLPFALVPVAYTLTFERLTLSEADWARVQAMARRREGGGDE